MFRQLIRQLLRSPVFYISSVLLALSMVLSCWTEDTSSLLYLYQYSIGLGITTYVVPIVSSVSICILLRGVLSPGGENSQKKGSDESDRFILSGVFTAAVSGILLCFCSFILFSLFFVIKLGGNVSFTPSLFSYPDPFYTSWSDQQLYLLSLVSFSVSGAIWPIYAYLAYFLTSNWFLGVCFPLLMKILLPYIAQTSRLFFLDPGQLLMKGIATTWFAGGLPFLFIYIFMTSFICLFIAKWASLGRKSDGYP